MPDQQEFPTFCTRFLRGCWCHLGSTDESRRTFHLTRVPMKELLRWKTFPPMDGGVFHRRSSFIRTLVRWKVLLALHRWRALHKAQGTWMCRETMVVAGGGWRWLVLWNGKIWFTSGFHCADIAYSKEIDVPFQTFVLFTCQISRNFQHFAPDFCGAADVILGPQMNPGGLFIWREFRWRNSSGERLLHRREGFSPEEFLHRTLVRWKVLLALHRWRALHKAQGTWMCRETMVVAGGGWRWLVLWNGKIWFISGFHCADIAYSKEIDVPFQTFVLFTCQISRNFQHFAPDFCGAADVILGPQMNPGGLFIWREFRWRNSSGERLLHRREGLSPEEFLHRTLVRWKVLLALHRWRALHKAQGTWMCRETMVVGGWWFSDIAWIIILFDLYDWQRRCQQLEPGGKSRQYCFRDFRDFWTDLSCRRTNQCSSQRSQRWVGIEMDYQ